MMLRIVRSALLLLLAGAAPAQRPFFDPDDFVDPGLRRGQPMFVSRLIVGVATDFIDGFRPLDQNAGFVHVANSFYWSHFQFDYKHSEVRGEEESGPARVQLCECSEGTPIYFPTPPMSDETPEAPPPGAKDSLQFGWYQPGGGAAIQRLRFSLSRQPVETIVTEGATGRTLTRFTGSEQSFGLDADLHLRIGGRNINGSLQLARTVRTGTTNNRSQTEVTYTGRLPALAVRRILVRSNLTIGGVSGRGGTSLNVISPAFEAFWHDSTTRANFHFVWTPQATRSGAEGWQMTHQVAVFIDRALFVMLFPLS